MEQITMILQYGILILLAILIFMLFIMMLSFFISGKILGSINDEFISSVKLVAFLILLGIALALISVGVQVYLPSFSVVANNVLLALSLVATIAIINRVYDLGHLKSFFFLVVAALINGLVGAAVFFLVGVLTPEPPPPPVFEPLDITLGDDEEGETEEAETSEDGTEVEETEPEVEEETEPEPERKGPALPGSTSTE